MAPAMIVLFTDFGLEGPYVGQMKAVLYREAPAAPVIDLVHDAPAHEVELAAYLLASYAAPFASGSVLLGVVDPGVGTAERRAVVVEAGGRWYVGPDNGLFDVAARRAGRSAWWEIAERPSGLSATFHGRDLFAPVAARLARGEAPDGPARAPPARIDAVADDLARVVYVDRFGNAITGLRAAALGDAAVLEVAGRRLARARTFADVPSGAPLWYENANGLAEIAVNRGRAADVLGLRPGTAVGVAAPPAARQKGVRQRR